MKDQTKIDELLNGYIDDQLSQRQTTEVQRLIAHDEQVAGRLRELEKCKMLLESLPIAEAPACMLEDIKSALERKTLLEQSSYGFDEHKGIRHLILRKVLAAAALIAIVAVLVAVVYTILGPQAVPQRPIAVEDAKPVILNPVKEVPIAEKPQPTLVATAEVLPDKPTARIVQFAGTLDVKTNSLIVVDEAIKRSIENNGLSQCLKFEKKDRENTYAISCTRDELSRFVADLKDIWPLFDSAALLVSTAESDEKVRVGNINAEQTAEIVNQASKFEHIEAAKKFASLNNTLTGAKGTLTAIDDGRGNLITPPKPLLTSGERRIKKIAVDEAEDETLNFTIVVSADN